AIQVGEVEFDFVGSGLQGHGRDVPADRRRGASLPEKNTGSLWMTRMARSRLRSSGTGNPFTRMEPDGESSLCAQTLTLRVRGAHPEPAPRYRNVAAVTTGVRNKQGMGRSGVGADPIGAAQCGEHAFIGAAAGHQQVPPYA